MSQITVYLLFTIPFALLLGSFISKRYCEGSIKVFKYIFYGLCLCSYIFLVINTTIINKALNLSNVFLADYLIPLFLMAIGGGVFFGIIFFLRPNEARCFIDKNKTLSKYIIYGFLILNGISWLIPFLKK